MILRVSKKLNECLQKIVITQKNNRLCMRKSNPVTIDCFASLD